MATHPVAGDGVAPWLLEDGYQSASVGPSARMASARSKAAAVVQLAALRRDIAARCSFEVQRVPAGHPLLAVHATQYCRSSASLGSTPVFSQTGFRRLVVTVSEPWTPSSPSGVRRPLGLRGS